MLLYNEILTILLSLVMNIGQWLYYNHFSDFLRVNADDSETKTYMSFPFLHSGRMEIINTSFISFSPVPASLHCVLRPSQLCFQSLKR